ncbi:MAG TPA: thiamine diphosphokinase [Candidatus Limnocylindrales bacterium]|nr:thiamine diphosphokinase [Candidatus Limnocylindrales bacterium]
MSPPAEMPSTEQHVLVVADGDVPARASLDAAWPGWADGVATVIAADGGLARARAVGLQPGLLVGDLDSLDPTLLADAEAAGLPIRRAPTAKDESDTELALLEALAAGATRVTMLGAFGGTRLDHALANLWLLAHPAAARAELVLLDERTRAFLVTARAADGTPVPRPLPGRIGATVSLLPFGGEALGVTTHGLRYPLRDEPLVTGPARGLSNVRDTPDAAVSLRAGRLLVVETPS